MERLNRSRRDKEDIPRIQRRTLQKKRVLMWIITWCDHSPRDRHPGVGSQLALGSITEQSYGGDGIPAELFQIPKDYYVKVLHMIWQ